MIEAVPQAASLAMASRGRMVIVIEDDESMREALVRLLSAAGFESLAWASAEEFLATQTDDGVACLVSDLRLPGISGLDLLALLRSRSDRTPFILVTAHDQPGQREESARRGATAYLIKPFRGTVLLETVRATIAPPGPS